MIIIISSQWAISNLTFCKKKNTHTRKVGLVLLWVSQLISSSLPQAIKIKMFFLAVYIESEMA